MKETHSQVDFTVDLFPINRLKQFGFVFKNNWKRFLFLGFLLVLFSLPLIVSLFIRDFRAFELVKSGKENLLLTNELFFSIFIIPSFVIFFIGLSGMFRIFRNYVWSEGILYKQDFLIGIKQNCFLFCAVGLFLALFYYLSYILSIYINVNFVKYIPFAIYLLIIIPVSLVELSMVSIYKNTLFKFVTNSLKIYIKKILHILVSEIIFLIIPAVLILVPMPLIVKYTILVVFIFALLPIQCFAFELLSVHIFDEVINKDNHKEIYRKGLSK